MFELLVQSSFKWSLGRLCFSHANLFALYHNDSRFEWLDKDIEFSRADKLVHCLFYLCFVRKTRMRFLTHAEWRSKA